MARNRFLHITALLITLCLSWTRPGLCGDNQTVIEETVRSLAGLQSRSTGSGGYEKAADYIRATLSGYGLDVQSFALRQPMRVSEEAYLEIDGRKLPLAIFNYNAITPSVADPDQTHPLIYIGRGTLTELTGKDLHNAIVVMESNSGKNWLNAASIGAYAAIFIGDTQQTLRWVYQEKEEETPLRFPMFWLDRAVAAERFGPLLNGKESRIPAVRLSAMTHWQTLAAENLYAFINGSDEQLKNQLLIIESSFDTRDYLPGHSPGGDAASSIATFLAMARELSASPPKRSVLLLATGGSAQALAGMREAVWSFTAKTKEIKGEKTRLEQALKTADNRLAVLDSIRFPLSQDPSRDKALADAVADSIDFAVDQVSRELMQLRLAQDTTKNPENIQQKINELARSRYKYRQLGWAEHYHDLPPPEMELLEKILPVATERNQTLRAGVKQQLRAIKSVKNFRDSVREYEIASIVSLHLSSHGDGVGAFNQGWLYNLKPTINRTASYSKIAEIFSAAAAAQPTGVTYRDTLRPSHLRDWKSWFLDRPHLGGEVAALAGQLGLSLVTTGDGRNSWGTPGDTVDKVDFSYLAKQAQLISLLLGQLANEPVISTGSMPRNGLASVSGRANLLLQGELFADYPGAGTTLLAYQGLNRYYAMVDETGMFFLKGIADKKHTLDKLIIEGYRFDDTTGESLWSIDKKETGKANYRLKIIRRDMQTNLVLFTSRQTTIFDLLEPRNFNYMTKLYLFDGRRDAPPQHYWYSRIDTRSSTLSSIYTEPGTRLKLTLSDTVTTNKMLLTNADDEQRFGRGYPVDTTPAIFNTVYHAAQDSWTLLLPRIDNLDQHGIHDTRINTLRERGLAALAGAESSFDNFNYAAARSAAGEALALAARVYIQVEKTQKDVLFGVLFYIALFVPFSYVMERFLFHYANIYKQIAAFSCILGLLIIIIYQVHPAFELAYSPMVVILAFFIIGLSFVVTLIIFFRFEDEMILLQRRASHKRVEEISRWKAFVAAFFLGVSNLRRHKLRTILTATTLIILTFTIMSFTTIKSGRSQVQLPFQPTAPYHGLLLKKLSGKSIPDTSLETVAGAAAPEARMAPRFWLESDNISQPVSVPLRHETYAAELKGLLGLSVAEAEVTGLDKLLSSGRWFTDRDRLAIILPEEIAAALQVTSGGSVTLWGLDFTVIGTFKAESFATITDLDGEIISPVIFPEEAGQELTEEEQEALESGDDVRSVQSRYQHIPPGQLGIIAADQLRAIGGKLKNIAIRVDDKAAIEPLASRLSDRFNLAVFAGTDSGVSLYNISDTMQYSGVPNIIIPLLISILIVLNTMISSVYERRNEIAVYTSVGLAPSHVAFLFVAEALALAVVSVVLGYLVAQVSASLLSATPLWAGITVNYSSMAGVAAMALVMIVVLLSVIYPARVAARIAIPDVNQTFRMPKSVDNRIRVTLPFLMKYRERDSIGGFVHEYLESHRDVSHGLFSTGPVKIVESCSIGDFLANRGRQPEGSEATCLHLQTNVWLAPFDFGIMQTVDFQFCQAIGESEFLEIQLTLHRQSGEDGVWQRLNTGFLHAFRKQLLIWRSLDDASHEQLAYAFQTLTGHGSRPQDKPEPVAGDA